MIYHKQKINVYTAYPSGSDDFYCIGNWAQYYSIRSRHGFLKKILQKLGIIFRPL